MKKDILDGDLFAFSTHSFSYEFGNLLSYF